jgi:hypothetical protein
MHYDNNPIKQWLKSKIILLIYGKKNLKDTIFPLGMCFKIGSDMFGHLLLKPLMNQDVLYTCNRGRKVMVCK